MRKNHCLFNCKTLVRLRFGEGRGKRKIAIHQISEKTEGIASGSFEITGLPPLRAAGHGVRAGVLNVLLGDNAQGKTNVLEAIYLMATLRSFRGVGGAHMVRHGAKGYLVGGKMVGG